MNPFTVTLTHAQANLIFNALTTHLNNTKNEANKLIQYLDAEFKKANVPTPAAAEGGETATTEQPTNG